TRRVEPSSPPSRTSLASGKSALASGAPVLARSAATAPPRTIAPMRTARLVARATMGRYSPSRPLLLQYEGMVNRNLNPAPPPIPAQCGVNATAPSRVAARILPIFLGFGAFQGRQARPCHPRPPPLLRGC